MYTNMYLYIDICLYHNDVEILEGSICIDMYLCVDKCLSLNDIFMYEYTFCE